MSTTRRAALGGLVSTIALAACGGSDPDGSGQPPAPAPSPTATPTPPAPPRAALNVLTLGMSVFLGADIVGPNYPDRGAFIVDNTPSRYFTKALTAGRRPIDGGVREYNAAVGGAFDHETPLQYAAAPGKPYDIVLLGLAMNSGSTYGVHGRGPNAAFTKDRLRNLLRDILAAGAIPFVCNTVHPWPEKITPASITAALYEGISWPPEQQSLLFSGPLVFDPGNSRFGSLSIDTDGRGLFERQGGGQAIRAGSKLLIQDGGGANAGIVLTVTGRLSGTTVEVERNVIREGGTAFGTVRHFDPPIDEFLIPPSTLQRQRKDWTGSGIEVDGLASYATWNAILADLCREENVKLIDLEYRGFKWVERYGWPSVYTSTYAGVPFETFNHPQLAAQRVVYGEMMQWLAGVINGGTLGSGFQVLRGPAIA